MKRFDRFSTVKRGGGKSLFLLIISLFFVSAYFSSCAKEEVAPEASTEAVAAKKKGEGGLEKDLPDCECEMRILDTQGYDGIWVLAESELGPYGAAIPGGYQIVGMGTQWNNDGNWVPLPSSFRPFATIAPNCYRLKLTFLPSPPTTTFTLSAEVECCRGSFGCFTTYPEFVFNPDQGNFGDFYRYFACEPFIEGEEPPCPPIK